MVPGEFQHNDFNVMARGHTEQSGIISSMATTGVVGVMVDCAIVAATNKNASSI